MSAALEYHRATDVAAGGTDEDETRMVGQRPRAFKEYGNAERLPLASSLAGPLLEEGGGIARSRRTPWGTVYFRRYSSAGALYPVEAYVVTPDGLCSFDPFGRSLVQLARGDALGRVAQAAAAEELRSAAALVILTGIPSRTGWKYLERGYRHVWWDAGTMLANLLALAATDDLSPRLYTAFVDRDVNRVLGVDGDHEYALAILALNGHLEAARSPWREHRCGPALAEDGPRYPHAERLHEAASLTDGHAVRRWRTGGEAAEQRLPRDELAGAIRRRGSIRDYGEEPLPREPLEELLAWSEAPIPADAAPVVRQAVAVAAVEGLEPGIYEAQLNLKRRCSEDELRRQIGFAAMEQKHPRHAAVNVFQLVDLEFVADTLGDRGYRWAQLEAGIRAGRLQVGAFARGWGAAASTFYDEEVSRALTTHEAPMLMVAIGSR